MDEDEIEMKDLLGHTDDKAMSSAEEGTRRKKKKRVATNSSKMAKKSAPPTETSRCILFIIFVSLFGTVFFGVEIFLSLKGTDDAPESVKKEHKIENQKPSNNEALNHLIGCKAPTMAEAQADCFNDPCFQFENDPEKSCDWVALYPSMICRKKYTESLLVKDVCPGSCGVCKDSKENEDDKESSSETEATHTDKNLYGLDYHMTIVDGVDDKDVYCEDLKQYEEWHNAKITKMDGPMFKVKKQMEHDKNAFT